MKQVEVYSMLTDTILKQISISFFFIFLTLFPFNLLCSANTKTFIKQHDLTTNFEELYAKDYSSATTIEQLREDLSNYRIIMVPGLFSNLASIVNQTNFGFLVKWLSDILSLEEGRDFIIAPINSFASSQTNAKVLREIIMESDKPIIFIGHSKGGVDLLETLIAYPEVHSKIKGIITIQSPFAGTPIADTLAKSLFLRTLLFSICQLSMGSLRSFLELQANYRQQYLRYYDNEITGITHSIPTINLVGWIPQEKKIKIPELKHQTIYSRFIHIFTPILINLGIYNNDYLVPKDSQLLNDAYFVNVDNADHLSLVMDSLNNQRDKMKVVLSLILLLPSISQ